MLITVTNEQMGGFLIIEGILSILFSESKGPVAQAARFIRIGIGYYIYEKTNFSETL